MAVTVTNSSYITDNTELFNYLDKLHIYQLLAQEESEVENTLSDALVDAQTDRLHQALNWGRSIIDTALRELYEVTAQTAATAPEIIKDLNSRFAQHLLERRRLRSGESPSESMVDLRIELGLLTAEGGAYSLTWTRKGGISSGIESKATQFDKSGQFDNIIPSTDQDEIWPDLANQVV